MFAVVGQIVATFAIMTNINKKAEMEEESTLERYSRYLQEMNIGGMKSMQSNPDDLETDCYAKTLETNDLFDPMFKDEYYETGELN